jgi:hypothetical protein
VSLKEELNAPSALGVDQEVISELNSSLLGTLKPVGQGLLIPPVALTHKE